MRTSKYSQEFRDSTVQLILNNNESVVKVSNDLDINTKTLYHWVRMYKKEHNIPNVNATSSTSNESAEEELKRLYGTRRIQDKLIELYGLIVSRKRISNIMKDLNLKVKMKREVQVNL